MGKKNKKSSSSSSPQSKGSEPPENSSQRENTQAPGSWAAEVLADAESLECKKRDNEPGKYQIKEQAKGARKGDQEEKESLVDNDENHEDENSNIDASVTGEGEANVQNRKDTVKEGLGNQNLRDKMDEQNINEQDEDSSQRSQDGRHGNEDRDSSQKGREERHLNEHDDYSSQKGRGREHMKEDREYSPDEDRDSSQKGREERHLNEYDDYSSQKGRGREHRKEDWEYSPEEGREEKHLSEHDDYSSQKGRGREHRKEDREYSPEEGRGREHRKEDRDSSQKGPEERHLSEHDDYSSQKGRGREHRKEDREYSPEEGRGKEHRNEDRDSSQKGREERHLSEHDDYSSQKGRGREHRKEDREYSPEEGRGREHRKEDRDSSQKGPEGRHLSEHDDYSSQKGRGREHRKEDRYSSQKGREEKHLSEYDDYSSQKGRGREHRKENREYSLEEGRGREHGNEDRYSSQKGREEGHLNEYDNYASQKGRGRGQRNEYQDNWSHAGRGRGQWNEHREYSSHAGRGRGQRNEYQDDWSHAGRGRGQWNKQREYSSHAGRGRGQRNEYQDSWSHAGRGRGQRKEYLDDSLRQGQGRYQNTQESYADRISKQNRKELDPKILAAMTCTLCNSFFNLEHRKPKCLNCGHTICSACVGPLIHRSMLGCPYCREPTPAKSSNCLRDNINILRMLTTYKGLLEASNAKTPSPHGSRCYEQGIPTTHYCTKCEQWICKACGDADHWFQKGCKLIPAREALERMESKCESDGLKAQTNISAALHEISSYQNIIKSCINIMRAAHESFVAEETHTQITHDEGEAKVEALKNAVSSFPKDGDIKKAQAAMRDVKNQCSDVEGRCSVLINNVKFLDDFRKISKKLLNLTAYLHANSSSVKPPPLAQVTTAEGIRYGRLIAENGRVHVYSVQSLSPENGTRAIPLEDVKALIDSSSALLFLDLQWGGRAQGRVYIRMLGDTKRGRLFQSLCLGDLGHTHKNTGFHRIWWKGGDGEHIWGGDYDCGDGGGGAAFCALDESLPAAASPRPIGRGLVAGRYEKEGISTIFRIYTRGAKEGEEEAAFGIVEHGLDVVAGAVGRGIVRDIKIADCGMVIEGQGLD